VIKLAKDATYTFGIARSGMDTAATGDLDVTAPLTIKGAGATIDANHIDGLLHVQGGSLKLSDATLTGGVGLPLRVVAPVP
jgi:hypothetical protein